MNGEQLFIAAITLVGPQLECISGLGDSVYLLVRMPHLGIRNVGWEAGIRTPIGGSRVRSLTVRRPPNVPTNLRKSNSQVKRAPVVHHTPNDNRDAAKILLALGRYLRKNGRAGNLVAYRVLRLCYFKTVTNINDRSKPRASK